MEQWPTAISRRRRVSCYCIPQARLGLTSWVSGSLGRPISTISAEFFLPEHISAFRLVPFSAGTRHERPGLACGCAASQGRRRRPRNDRGGLVRLDGSLPSSPGLAFLAMSYRFVSRASKPRRSSRVASPGTASSTAPYQPAAASGREDKFSTNGPGNCGSALFPMPPPTPSSPMPCGLWTSVPTAAISPPTPAESAERRRRARTCSNSDGSLALSRQHQPSAPERQSTSSTTTTAP